ncbi:MAG: PAS domain-containing protein [Methylobacter sp.]
MPIDTTQQKSQPEPAGRSGVLAIVLVYAMFAAGWILLSDKLVEMIFTDPNKIILVSMLKGWLYVGVTSLLLYGLMQRRHGDIATVKTTAAESLWLSVPFLSLAAIIIAFTSMNVINTFMHEKKEEIGRLQAVADIKAGQINDLLKQKQSDADFVQSSDFFTEQYRRRQEFGDQHTGERLQVQLELLRRNRELDSVMVLTPTGGKLWESGNAPLSVAQPLQAAVQLAAADHKVRRVGPYRDADGNMYLDFIAPLTAIPGPSPLVILRIDLKDWLSPILQTRPVTGASAETLLFQRNGNQVIVINEAKHQEDTAVELRAPTETEKLFINRILLAKDAQDAPVEGLDYRGIEVVGAVRAIAGTDWLLLTQLDQSELYSEAIRNASWNGLVGLLALFMAGAGFYLLLQNQQLAISQAVQQSQAERLRALHLLSAIADSSDDAIFAKDMDGCYLLFNRAASLFVGKPAEEVLGNNDHALFPSTQAKMLISTDRRIITESSAITQEEELDTLNGKRIFLTTKGPLRDSDGNVIGTFGIARNITERKRTEAALHATELSYRSLFENMMNGVVHARIIFQEETPVDIEYISTNPAFATVSGITEAVAGRRISEVIPGYCENNPESLEIFGHVATTGISTRWEHYLHELNRWFSFMIYSPNRGEVIIVTENITERKQAELALRESESRFRALVEQSLAGIYIIQDNRFRYVNPGFAAIFGYNSPESLIDSVSVTDLVYPEDREQVKENVRRRIEGKITDLHYTFTGLRRDGSRTEVEAHGHAIDYQGCPAIIGFILNITERKTAEAQLRTSEERLKLALAATNDGLWDWNLVTGLSYLTPHYYEMTGYRPDQVTPDFEFFKHTVHPDDLPHVLKTMEAHLQGRTTASEFDYRLVTASGNIKWIRGRGQVVERDASGAPVRMIGTITDISARKAVEEALRRQTHELAQRNEELERFNRATVGRELDMIALKQQINELARQLGQEPIYPLAFLDTLPEQQHLEET